MVSSNAILDRRTALKLAAMTGVAQAAGLSAWAQPSSSGSLRLESTGKNVVRYSLGDIGVLALSDGYAEMSAGLLRQNGGEAMGRLPASVVATNRQLRLSVNTYLIFEDNRRILIDTGAADSWVSTTGQLLTSLREAGIGREEISDVALTHTHADHINGLLASDGSVAFPRLQRIYVPQEEVTIFRSGRLARLETLVVPMGENFPVSQRITAIKALGHSAGHTAYEILSNGVRLLVWGDTVHVPSIQFERPELTWAYDSDQAKALRTRLVLLARVAVPNCYVAGMHLDFPGVGRVRRKGEAFDYQVLV